MKKVFFDDEIVLFFGIKFSASGHFFHTDGYFNSIHFEKIVNMSTQLVEPERAFDPAFESSVIKKIDRMIPRIS